MLNGHLVYVGETVTDLQILGCELQQNASGGRAPPRSAGEAITLHQTPQPLLSSKGGMGKERVGNRKRGERDWD